MTLVEVLTVSLSKLDRERLWGRNIELPQPGEQTEDNLVDLVGWVLGRSSPVVAVELVADDAVIRRVPLAIHRPDVEAAFPQVPDAAQSGFRTSVSVTGMAKLELLVQAVLQDQTRVPLGVIHARRRWREGD